MAPARISPLLFSFISRRVSLGGSPRGDSARPSASTPVTSHPFTFSSTFSEWRMRPASRSSAARRSAVSRRDSGGSSRGAGPPHGENRLNTAASAPVAFARATRARCSHSPRAAAGPRRGFRARAISRLCASSARARTPRSSRSFAVAASAICACRSNSTWNFAACALSSSAVASAATSRSAASRRDRSPGPPVCVEAAFRLERRAVASRAASRDARCAESRAASRASLVASSSRCSRCRCARNFSLCAASRGVGPGLQRVPRLAQRHRQRVVPPLQVLDLVHQARGDVAVQPRRRRRDGGVKRVTVTVPRSRRARDAVRAVPRFPLGSVREAPPG